MRKVTIGMCLLWVMLISGCSFTTAGDRAVIHNDMLNATAMNAKVQSDPNALPEYVKESFSAYAKMFVALDAWAAGQKFPVTTTSVGGK